MIKLKNIGILPFLYKAKQRLFSTDKDVMTICARNGAYEYLRRYVYACKSDVAEWHPTTKKKIIWTCWLQGLDNAPELVKKCISEMHKYAGDYEVRVVDATYLDKYTNLPKYIIEKHDKGIIPHAHFSDMVRLNILQKYGGIWIDSTILLTASLPSFVTNSDFFAFSTDGVGKVKMGVCLIASCAGHPIIEDVYSMLCEYWKNENKLVSYSIFHLFLTIAIESSTLNKELWEQTPKVHSTYIDMLLPQLGRPFNPDTFKIATQLSSLHKLTYKYKEYGIDINKKGTFYDVLINGNDAERNENTAL